jgi:hypothetical protein
MTQTPLKPCFKNFDNKDNWVIILYLKNDKLKMQLNHSQVCLFFTFKSIKVILLRKKLGNDRVTL